MHTVMTQTEGSAPETSGTFSTEAEALEHILSLGGSEDDTATVPGELEADPDTLVYNLGREPGCAIAWIESD